MKTLGSLLLLAALLGLFTEGAGQDAVGRDVIDHAGSCPNPPPPPPPRPGVQAVEACPTGKTAANCIDDSNCTLDQKCCPDSVCTKICKKSVTVKVHAGSCPPSPIPLPPHPDVPGPCPTAATKANCVSDLNCAADEKCCPDSICTTKCKTAVIDGADGAGGSWPSIGGAS